MPRPSATPMLSYPAVDRPRAVWPALFVWTVWAVLLVFALGFVAVYGCDVPQWDDWDVLPWLVGERPVTWSWLWSAHNEHRIPLPKLLLVGLAAVSGGDLRAAMTVNALTLAAAAAVLIWATRSRRGFTVAADAVFPLALLHAGQQQNLLWGFQVGFVVGAVLVSLLLAAVLRGGGLTGAAGAVLLLPLCGANTLAFAPPLAVWLGYAGLVRWRTDGPRAALPALAGAAGTAVLVGLYFLGWHGPPRETAPSLGRGLQVTAQVLSTAAGPAGAYAWPHTAVLVAVLSVGTAMLLATAVWRGTDRVRALGLLALLAGFATLAVGIGWGRGHMRTEGAGLANRYVTLLAPLVCLLYSAWELYLPPMRARLAQTALLGVLLLLLVPSTLDGLARGREQWHKFEAVRHDVRAGASPRELAQRHYVLCPPASEDVAVAGLELLRQRRLGPYAELATPVEARHP